MLITLPDLVNRVAQTLFAFVDCEGFAMVEMALRARLLIAAWALFGTLADARADAPECVPLADAQRVITDEGGGVLKRISRDELLFARGLFAASPPVSSYPPGEDGMIALFEDGTSAVLFVEGFNSCGKMGVSAPMTKLLLDIDKSI